MIRSAAAFWKSYLATLPPDHPPQKRATASLPVEFTAGGDPLPTVGDVDIVTLADGEPVCIIETTEVRLVVFGEVDAAFAADEGEGDGRFRLLYQRP